MVLLQWLIPLVTLTAMELVLGIDNIVFLVLVISRLPAETQAIARRLGLGLAMGGRIGLLLLASWVMRLQQPIFHLSQLGLPLTLSDEMDAISWRDLILIGGGLFLIAKSVVEIHHQIEGSKSDVSVPRRVSGLGSALAQIVVLDLVFSLDSVITAIGMAQRLEVMIAAIMAAVGLMLVFSGPISHFVQSHPSVRMLALSFLILIGVMLVAEGIEKHIERGYIYFAMAFALAVEMLNLRARPRTQI